MKLKNKHQSQDQRDPKAIFEHLRVANTTGPTDPVKPWVQLTADLARRNRSLRPWHSHWVFLTISLSPAPISALGTRRAVIFAYNACNIILKCSYPLPGLFQICHYSDLTIHHEYSYFVSSFLVQLTVHQVVQTQPCHLGVDFRLRPSSLQRRVL